jgi:hypothetical protein
VQVSGAFGSRQEEAQRLGRILRPKPDGRQALFYTLVSRDTREEEFADTKPRHAFRVASGLDSMVLGEPQILGQLKEAVRSAEAAGTLGTVLNKLFQRSFAVPVHHVASGGCGASDGRVLRVFPSGGWMRVTAFNLDTPAAGNVVSATFRVTVPPLETSEVASMIPSLFTTEATTPLAASPVRRT